MDVKTPSRMDVKGPSRMDVKGPPRDGVKLVRSVGDLKHNVEHL